ncbi:FAD-dependent oxidoreductase [Burkholderia anthina]|uniref:FAD-dependent oxidoreductase n=1 Tax=Burkholderia anthina TaxID=179879 RepID=UPI001CF39421|nr:FAD-dependent oxidoreductase [Burkholderia anthina]MCA8094883.1 FAD-dependent oxidoreductase [Burkholderia anthina]
MRDVRGNRPKTVDIVVAGAGMGGLCAAVRAARSGARVLLLEKAARPGGTMILSGGGVWGVSRYEDLREHIPRGDPALHRAWVETLPIGQAWLDELGIPVGSNPNARLRGMADTHTSSIIAGKQIVEGRDTATRTINPPQFTELMLAEFQKHRGTLLTEAPLVNIERDEAGCVNAVAYSQGAHVHRVETRAVVLATGGFGANRALVKRHITPYAEQVWRRCAPTVTGDGLALATAIGAATAGDFGAFYGHNLPARPAQFGSDEWIQVSQYYGPAALAINLNGERFMDEGETRLEETIAQDTARQPQATAAYVFDEAMWQTYLDPHSGFIQSGVDKVAFAREAGGKVLVAATLDVLCALVAEAGFDGARMHETITAFNAAALQGRTAGLEVPKTRYVFPLLKPPFYAVVVQPGITGTMGGLKVDAHARVLDGEGEVIEGLYAAGVDVGNLNNRHYGGMLSTGLVFGIRAADHVTRNLLT